MTPHALNFMSFLETTAGRALTELTAGRAEAAQKILLAEFERDFRKPENFELCRIHNLIQHGMIAEAEDALRRKMFSIPADAKPATNFSSRVSCESGCYAGGHKSPRNQAFNGQ